MEISELGGIRVSRETVRRLEIFCELFNKWARSINLVAPSTVGDMWSRHILDSAQIYSINPSTSEWIDLGSGGGFPGVITAILLNESGGGWVNLVESNHKKASFLRTALRETGARGSVNAIRIEDAPSKLEKCDAISARALADLDLLLNYSSHWMVGKAGVKAFFHKGRDYMLEVEKARSEWSFDLVTHKSTVEADSYVLEISNLARLAN